jgi:hypothetical protein
LRFIGERLDAIFKAAQKGSHASITTRDEAERYVIYTYMLTGDILSLTSSVKSSSREQQGFEESASLAQLKRSLADEE